MRILTAVLLCAGLALSSAHAQTGTAERPAVWLGLGTEFFLIPEMQLSASAPVYRTSSVNVNVRGTVDASFGLYALGADVLLNQGDRGWYGGPSAAVILGAPQTGWVAGALAGYRALLGEHVGFFVEGRVRYLHLPGFVENRMAPQPGQPVPAPTDFSYVSPGLHVGLTYRF